ncbi:MAG: sigma-54 dependent transcriptional regulator [Pseudomonadota bacterium]
MELDTLPAIQWGQARYLAYEMVKTLAPGAEASFEARFQGLWSYYRDRGPALKPEVAEAQPDYSELALTLQEGRPSGRFIPLIVDALFLDFLGLHQHDNPWEVQARFCEEKLAGFVRKYFPELDRRREAFKHLQKICRDLYSEAESLTQGEDIFSDRPYLKGRPEPLLQSRNHLWEKIMAMSAKAAWSRAPILLTGESGVGKEILARFMHRRSPRLNGPFVAVNCGALPENLMESELFGYRKGAFTGADKDKPGLALQAQGGTLFLDEVGQMQPALQVKLLRFLQDHALTPLGAVRPVRVDVRVIAATNQDLDLALQVGGFRRDLYYRLNVIRLDLPPLRHRKEDIPALISHFIKIYNQENRAQTRGFTREALSRLMDYTWPGNVRELENVIQRAVILAGSGWMGPEHLPEEVIRGRGEVAVSPDIGPETKLHQEALESAVVRALEQSSPAAGQTRRLGVSVPWSQLLRFFAGKETRPFAPRDLAAFITPPGRSFRRDKLSGQILKALSQAGIVEHNGRSSQAARYRLSLEFVSG